MHACVRRRISSSVTRRSSSTLDALVLGDQRGELADQPPAGRRAAGVDDPARAVPAFEPEREVPVPVGIEPHSERREALHRQRRLLAEHPCRRLSHHAAAGC